MASISYVQCFVDGAVRNNGKPDALAACACIIYDKKKEIIRFSRSLSVTSNNAAEYEAVIHTLLICISSGFPRPIIYTDSALVVNHTTGKWQCRTESLLPYYLTVQNIKNEYLFDIIHVPRAKVHVADALCNAELDDFQRQKQILHLQKSLEYPN